MYENKSLGKGMQKHIYRARIPGGYKGGRGGEGRGREGGGGMGRGDLNGSSYCVADH